jgi:hypothetical protein
MTNITKEFLQFLEQEEQEAYLFARACKRADERMENKRFRALKKLITLLLLPYIMQMSRYQKWLFKVAYKKYGD